MATNDNNSSLDVDHELRRLLYLGTEGSLWKTTESEYAIDSASTTKKLFDEACVSPEVFTRFHKEGWFVHPDTLSFVLALAGHSQNLITKHHAFTLAEEICHTSSAMLAYVHFITKASHPKTGWGRALRNFISHWYLKKEAKTLAVEVTKVISSHRWSHKDVLCLAHVKATKPDTAAVLKYLIKGIEVAEREFAEVPEAKEVLTYLKAVHELKHTTDHHVASRLIEIHDLAFEHLPSKLLKSREIWTCLIPRLKLKLLLQQLPYLYKIGILRPNSPQLKALLERLRDENALSDGDVGPFETFLPIRQWEASNRVLPSRPLIRQNVPQLDEALLRLHLSSYNKLLPTGKRYLVVVDVRGTMVSSRVVGCSCISPADVTAILLSSFVKTETSNLTALAFSHNELVPLELNDKMNLSEIAQLMRNVPVGPVNLIAPVEWAAKNKEAFDAIVILTDNQPVVDGVHPANALKEYRSSMNLPNTRFVVCALGSRGFSVAMESGMLDIAGFHMKLLQVIQDFARCVF